MHLFASPKTENSISKTLQSAGRRYAQHSNDTYSHTSTLCEERHKATVINSDQQETERKQGQTRLNVYFLISCRLFNQQERYPRYGTRSCNPTFDSVLHDCKT